ncbi:hypothetical protein [Magnetospirillum sp. 64-120]|mgnify:CR=1 FL=1|uniref:hypothetical protein n=1 Tax=Magnetospirillum sp. 64-120 TaxID=1895778 RepID=UPI0025C729F4|nr:hypothetical protein [Magnetospirillum sp. 64-120]
MRTKKGLLYSAPTIAVFCLIAGASFDMATPDSLSEKYGITVDEVKRLRDEFGNLDEVEAILVVQKNSGFLGFFKDKLEDVVAEARIYGGGKNMKDARDKGISRKDYESVRKEKIIKLTMGVCSSELSAAEPDKDSIVIVSEDRAAARYEIKVKLHSTRFGEEWQCTAVGQDGKGVTIQRLEKIK